MGSRIEVIIEVMLESILQEQQRTNQLLMMLVEALAEGDDEMDYAPLMHLDGSPVDG